MKMEVEIISKDKIKPSSPTPSHLRIFKLSLLDQLIPAPYAPVILFYAPVIAADTTSTTTSSGDHCHDDDDEEDHDHDDDDVTLIMKNRLHLLKTSLAETLTGFYPLAGEIKDDLSIDCNDEGANYVEARVKYTTLHDFLSRPDLLLLQRFLPCDLAITAGGSSSSSVTNIQVNVFKCGGIAIGLCISHKILDGAALCTFLKAWTAIARLRSSIISISSSSSKSLLRISSSSSSPSDSDDHQAAGAGAAGAGSIVDYPMVNLFAATFLFPTNNELWLRDSCIAMWGSLFIKDDKSSCVTKRFVFDASAIAALKDKVVVMNKQAKRPTRVEVVSAFIWQCAMAASKQQYGFQRPSMLSHVVNLRSRIGTLDLNLENSTGNLVWIAAARCPMSVLDDDDGDDEVAGSPPGIILHGLVGELRKALSKIDGEFVEKMRSPSSSSGSGKSLMLESLEELRSCRIEEEDYYGISSWCNFGLYEAADFGWGKPIWVSSIASTGCSVFMNLIILVDTKLGDGIEAWVTLDHHHMVLLQSNSYLQKFASLDPSPLRNF